MYKCLNQERIELKEFAALGLPQIQVLGRADFAAAQEPLDDHTHPGKIEITYFARGKQTFSVENERYTVTGGDVFIVYPDEVHGTNGEPREKSMMYWLILTVPGLDQRLFNFSSEETRQIFNSLLDLKSRHFAGTPNLKQILNEIITNTLEERLPLRQVFIRNKLVEFLLNVIYCGDAGQEPPRQTEDIVRILSLIEQNIEERILVDDLADRVALSPSRLRMKFKEQIGIPISEFILRKKIDKSVEYLSTQDFSITEVAHELGFSSSQYYATTFKRYVGKSPTQFLLTL